MRNLTLCIYLLLSMTCLALSPALAGPLHDAAFIGDIDEVKRLIAEGININQEDFGGRTPLHMAARGGHAAVAEQLIAAGADVNARDFGGRTPLHMAARSGYKNMVQLLKRHGAKGRVAKRSAKKKSSKWQAISEDEAKLVFYAPGLEEATVKFERAVLAPHDTAEKGHWQARHGQWPQAWLLFRHLRSSFQFAKGRPLGEIIQQIGGASITLGYGGKSRNHIGELEFQRFTWVIGGAHIRCVGMRQYAGYEESVGYAKTSMGDTVIFGRYCAEAPALQLSNETLTKVFEGIGVRGVGMPVPPLGLARTEQAGSYRIGIFPFDARAEHPAWFPLERITDMLHRSIKRDPTLVLAYSYYDDMLNAPRIKKPDRLWAGNEVRKEPNLELVYQMGRERKLDGIIMVWGRWARGVLTEFYMIDIESRQIYHRKGTAAKASLRKMVKEVFSDFVNGRGAKE